MTHQDAREKRTESSLNTAEAAVLVLQGQRILKASLTVPFGDLTDSDGAQTFAFAAALPATAIILAVGLDITVGFTDGSIGVFTADLGIDGGDVDAFLDGVDIATIDKLSTPRGTTLVGGYALLTAVTPALTILADVNVDTATAGSVVAEVFYVDGATL